MKKLKKFTKKQAIIVDTVGLTSSDYLLERITKDSIVIVPRVKQDITIRIDTDLKRIIEDGTHIVHLDIILNKLNWIISKGVSEDLCIKFNISNRKLQNIINCKSVYI